MRADRKAYAIVLATLAMARSLGLKTLAEGVEEASQREMLLERVCDLGQGYCSGRPQPAEAFAEKWLAAGFP